MINMIKKVFITLFLCIILLHPQFIHADNSYDIEIFDPQENKVIKTVEPNQEINNKVKDWINKIEEVYQSINPMPDNGYAIRFPIESSIHIQNKWIDENVKEVYLTIPENDDPCLIIFGRGNQPNFFEFPGQIDELSKLLGFQLK